MRHATSEDLLDLALDLLPNAERRGWQDHLISCSDCERAYRRHEQEQKVLKAAAAPAHSTERLEERILAKTGRFRRRESLVSWKGVTLMVIAASCLLAVFVGIRGMEAPERRGIGSDGEILVVNVDLTEGPALQKARKTTSLGEIVAQAAIVVSATVTRVGETDIDLRVDETLKGDSRALASSKIKLWRAACPAGPRPKMGEQALFFLRADSHEGASFFIRWSKPIAEAAKVKSYVDGTVLDEIFKSGRAGKLTILDAWDLSSLPASVYARRLSEDDRDLLATWVEKFGSETTFRLRGDSLSPVAALERIGGKTAREILAVVAEGKHPKMNSPALISGAKFGVNRILRQD